VAKLPIHSNLFEFIVQRVGFAQIMRIPELSDEIGSTHQQTLIVLWILRLRR
jgi:hypothetical protein